MKAKLARAGAAALLILVMAVTPLSAFLNGGVFETRLPSSWGGGIGSASVHVTMYDQTAMVRGISAALPGDLDIVVNPGANTYVLEVSWIGGCGDREAELTLRRTQTGYALDERTTAWGCPLDLGLSRSVAMYLWSPIDASTVTFSSSG